MTKKYIIVPSMGIPVAILFCELLGHDDVARAFPQGRVLSAGFVSIVMEEEGGTESRKGHIVAHAHCYGESTTLHLKPGLDDAEIIEKQLLG